MRLPPGPRMPRTLQTIAWWNRSVPFLERCRERYGKRFTMRMLQTPPFVHHSEPEHLREIFTAPPEVLHPGEGARVLEPVLGVNSVILLDERPHLSQRKLMLPAFHGEKMQRLSGLVEEVAEREVARWPKDEPIALHPRLQALTLEIILRAVFGLDAGERLDTLRHRLTRDPGRSRAAVRDAADVPARAWVAGVRARSRRVGRAHLRDRSTSAAPTVVKRMSGTTSSRCSCPRATRTGRRWRRSSCATS